MFMPAMAASYSSWVMKPLARLACWFSTNAPGANQNPPGGQSGSWPAGWGRGYLRSGRYTARQCLLEDPLGDAGDVVVVPRVWKAPPMLGWFRKRRYSSPANSGGGARLSLEESRRKEHQGGRGSSSLDPPFLGWGALRGDSFFFAWPAAHEPTPVTARPPAGRAGRGWFCRREGKHSAKPSPWGEGAPVRTLGRMRGDLVPNLSL